LAEERDVHRFGDRDHLESRKDLLAGPLACRLQRRRS
jgi:hypothetical protein